jgi:hypothetical protein
MQEQLFFRPFWQNNHFKLYLLMLYFEEVSWIKYLIFSFLRMKNNPDNRVNSKWMLVAISSLSIIAGLSSNILADWISLGGLPSQIICLVGSVIATIGLLWFKGKESSGVQ